MKKMNVRNLIMLAVLFVGMLFTSCQKEHSKESLSGKLKIQLTDAPFPSDLVAEANVTINKIEIRKANENEENPYVTISEKEMSFNLLDLTNGVTAGLVDLDIKAGSYDLIRMHVSESNIVLSDGTVHNLKIPSGSKSGIKIFVDPSIEISGAKTTEILLDFDVSRSFKVQGNINSPKGIKGFIFKPVIKASNLSTTGSITGNVLDASDEAIDGVQISLIDENDAVYTTTFTDNGAYEILGVKAGTYKVEFSKNAYQTTTIENIEVTSGKATVQDAKLVADQAAE